MPRDHALRRSFETLASQASQDEVSISWQALRSAPSRHRLEKPCHRNPPKSAQPASAYPGESRRSHDRAIEPAGDFFQPRCKIDGGTDAGEVEPVAAADIAVQNSSDVQRDSEAEALDR